MSNIFQAMLVFCILLIVAFLIMRQFVLWYWKVNIVVKNLEDIESHLHYLVNDAKAAAEKESSATRERP